MGASCWSYESWKKQKPLLAVRIQDGIYEQKILPWLAEIAFEQCRYDEVKRCLSALSQTGEKGKELALVKAWWNK